MVPADDFPPAVRARELGGLKVVNDETLSALDREEHHRAEVARCREIYESDPPKGVPLRFRKTVEFPEKVRVEIDGWLHDFWMLDRDENERCNLVLIGRPGCGKTHAVWSIVTRLLLEKAFDRYRFEEVHPLLEELAHMASNRQSDKSRIEPLCTTQLLLLDDLGRKRLTEPNENKLLQIIDARFQRMLPTVLTTNIGAPQWSNAIDAEQPGFGDRIASRLGQRVCRAVAFPQVDHRKGFDYATQLELEQ